ncbi:MAG: c-type cytochrome [Pseudomonadota bacterium]
MLAVALCLASGASWARADDQVARGLALYESKCFVCHAVDSNRIGPMHKDVFGRRAGSVPNYAYSDALRRSAIVWNADTLERWLENPEQLIPGQAMGVSVSQSEERKLLIAYLKSISRAGSR